MAVVSVTNIRVLNNPCPLNAPFLFEIHFEAQQALKHDVEWRVVYVGSGEHHGNSNSNSTCIAATDKSAAGAATAATAAATAAEEEEGCMHADGAPSQPGDAAAACISKPQNIACKKQYSRGADYVLDSVLLGPIERGALAFEFAVNAPDFTQMDPGSVEGMQAVLVCGLYKGKEFVRIGYYLNNAYSDSTLRENPPEIPLYDRLVRCVVDAPRVTRFQIDWDEEEDQNPCLPAAVSEGPPQQQQQQEQEQQQQMINKGAPGALGGCGHPLPMIPQVTAAEVCEEAPKDST